MTKHSGTPVIKDDPPALRAALDLLARGLWPVPIHAPGDILKSREGERIAVGKEPIGRDWGRTRPTEATLRASWRKHPRAGVGLRLGKESGVIDVEVDDRERGLLTLAALFGGEVLESLGWESARGSHRLLAYDDRLERYGKSILKGSALPGIEIRIGATSAGGKQLQSVVPPTPNADGTPRVWNGFASVAPIPDSVFGFLDSAFRDAEKPAGPAPRRPRREDASAEKRARAYLEKLPAAIEGQRGHDRLYHAACVLVDGFALPYQAALPILRDWNEAHAVPPESEKQLEHKLTDAIRNTPRSGNLLTAERPSRPRPAASANGHHGANGHAPLPPTLPAAATAPEPSRPAESGTDPHRLARLYLKSQCRLGDGSTLRFWNDEWHRWDGRAWRVCPDREIHAELTGAVKADFDRTARALAGTPLPVTTKLVANAAQALRDLALLRLCDCPRQPAWLGPIEPGEDLPEPAEVLPAGNALVHLPALIEGGQHTMPLTPRFFSPVTLGYPFQADPPPPENWLKFLGSVWPDDPDSIASLQEWFGYLLTFDTGQQKILMLIGPKRSGKGTIARVLRGIVGPENVAAPTLSGLATNFGLAPLIGKTVAVISDARLSARADQAVIVERLLSVSGEDAQTIDRKHRTSWTGALLVRFVLISNELPRLGDASGAVPSRMILLRMTRSFFGAEDTTLTARLLAERTSILRWAVDGWARLRRRGHFLQPESGQELLEDLRELSSPVGSFVAERCRTGPECEVGVQELFNAWKEHCQAKGRDRPGDEAGFGRHLRAVLPALKTSQVRRDGSRLRIFRGIELLGRLPF